MSRLRLGLALVALATACNEVPIAGLEKSFSLSVTIDAGGEGKLPIDFLWVIDNTPSMCDEQVALTDAFGDFKESLDAVRQVDPRVAVITLDMHCDPAIPKVAGRSMGRFNRAPATSFPPSCQRRLEVACLKDGDCDLVLGDAGKWRCDPGSSAQANQAQCMRNANCTLNSTCTRRCLEDQECQDYFKDPRFVCHKPDQFAPNFGCILPPSTATCPAELPSFLTSADIGLFPCLATVGINQEKCLRWEQSFKAAWNALDVLGPNGEQARSFLREEAYLVIVFVSDEDDCSSLPEAEGAWDSPVQGAQCAIGAAARAADVPLCEENPWPPGQPALCGDLEDPAYNQCLYNKAAYAEASDSTDGGLLEPPSHYVNRYKALKSDPSKVVVAAISGDSPAQDPDVYARERRDFVLSKGHPRDCFNSSSVCSSAAGKADWGSRYQELAEGFGANGVFANICDQQGAVNPIAGALAQIQELILRVVNKLCLPKPVAEGVTLRVVRTDVDGKKTPLTLGEGADTFSIVEGGDACRVDGRPMPALVFYDPPEHGESLYVEYQGDPLLD